MSAAQRELDEVARRTMGEHVPFTTQYDTRRSLEAGRRVSVPVPHTIADGQAATIPGELTFAINRRLVEAIVLVTDDEIREATHFALTRLKIVVEPSGATGLAALLCRRVRPAPRLSGGNLDL